MKGLSRPKPAMPSHCDGPNRYWQRLLWGRMEIVWKGWPWRRMKQPGKGIPDKPLWRTKRAFVWGLQHGDFWSLQLGCLVVNWGMDPEFTERHWEA